MKLLLDMNVSRLCLSEASLAAHEVLHWCDVGRPDADDEVIMVWARSHGCVIVTHDLDFGRVLSLTNAGTPSVVQIRAKRMAVPVLARLIAEAVATCEQELQHGALVTLDMLQRRVRVLPLRDPDWLTN